MKILVAMSGGVDSSVAAYLMKCRHESCSGATMLLFLNESLGLSSRHPCCSFENIQDARSVCGSLGIGHEVLNFMPEFEERVIKKFVGVYESGGTPNPCVDCNKFLKFDIFLRHASENGFDGMATGHYARIERDERTGRFLLKKAEDSSRDQSYVLYMMTQEQLARVEFPLGTMKKTEVRELASGLGFTNARKHDSQDICFVPDGDYAGFIESYTGHEYEAGDFVDSSGRKLGVHRGIIHYTMGQRRGLGVSGSSRLYVSSFDIERNTITLSSGDEDNLFFRALRVREINLIPFPEIQAPIRAGVKTRYRQKESPALITQTGSDELLIEFDTPQRAPATGQAAVIYDGDTVIGGGTISEMLR